MRKRGGKGEGGKGALSFTDNPPPTDRPFLSSFLGSEAAAAVSSFPSSSTVFGRERRGGRPPSSSTAASSTEIQGRKIATQQTKGEGRRGGIEGGRRE